MKIGQSDDTVRHVSLRGQYQPEPAGKHRVSPTRILLGKRRGLLPLVG
jgi:hypothetical protein